MDDQEQNLCLLNMPVLVLEKILSNFHNPSNVSRTCKYLYEMVCRMENSRRVLHISAFDAKSPLNIDAKAVFDSMMHSRRTIKEIELRVGDYDPVWHKLKERQMKRITAIMNRFGANITSLKLHGLVLPINFILELLQESPKLESLSFIWVAVWGSVTENATMSLQLPRLKVLQKYLFSDIGNLIPAGSLNYVDCYDSIQPEEGLMAILAKQHNIKSLTLDVRSNSDLTDLCIDHLQLESLTFKWHIFNDISQSVEILKCQTNLKELRFKNYYNGMSGSVFRWICNNLKKLEVFEVDSSIEGNASEMLGELKHLRHFRTSDANYLFNNGFQSFQFASESIEKFEFGPKFSCGELLSKVVNSMAHSLPNLTHLTMRFKKFSALCFVLRQCTKIIHITIHIRDSIPDQLAHQRYPNIQSLELHHKNQTMKGQTMTLISRAMPNLKSMSLLTRTGIKFDVKTMNEFIKESESLEYLYVDRFKLHGELSADDVVETIRRLIDQLKGYRIKFSPSPEDLNLHQIKDSLRKLFYVRDVRDDNLSFYLYKSGKLPVS